VHLHILLHVSKVLFLVLSVTFFFVCLFVPQISGEWLNRFVPNSHGGSVQSLTQTSLNVKVKGQRSRSPGTKNALSTLITPDSIRMVCARCKQHAAAAAADGAIRLLPGGIILSAVYVW